MKVTFLGVGEACDQNYPNTSILVHLENNNEILLDCGFTTPHQFFKQNSDPENLRGLWISHFHGDHFFGTPLLLLRFWEMERTNPFVIIGGKGVKEKVGAIMELAYPGFFSKLKFPLEFIEMKPGKNIHKCGLEWRGALVDHSQEATAVYLSSNGSKLFYSGDGRPTPESINLAKGCDLVIHESYRIKGDTQGHCSLKGCIAFIQKAGVKNLALVHIARHEREGANKYLEKIAKENSKLNICIPIPGEELLI